jgi:hypothetical protein
VIPKGALGGNLFFLSLSEIIRQFSPGEKNLSWLGELGLQLSFIIIFSLTLIYPL